MVSDEHKRLIDSLDSKIDLDFEFKKRTEVLVKAIPFGASIYQKYLTARENSVCLNTPSMTCRSIFSTSFSHHRIAHMLKLFMTDPKSSHSNKHI